MSDYPKRSSARRTSLGIFGVLLVLALVLSAVILWLRGELRQRIVNRDLAVFHQLVKSTLRDAEEQYLLGDEFFEGLADPLDGLDANIPQHLVEALLGTMGVVGVDALVLFDQDGFLQDAFPANPGADVLPPSQLESFARGRPDGELAPAALELTLPVSVEDGSGRLFHGVARYYLESEALRVELAGLDAQLWATGGILLLVGGGVVVWILMLAFQRLERANRLLEERGQHLADANRKLLLAAKSAALGSLTANLMHGLKNPLSGLQQFVRGLKESSSPHDSEEVQLAAESARRMQDLIQDTLAVIGDAEAGVDLRYTLEELHGILLKKLEPIAVGLAVQLKGDVFPAAELDSIRGNLLVLVLFNLAQNAVEASDKGQAVTITCEPTKGEAVFKVSDVAGGLPLALQKDPFQPVRSSKPGGSGIGLALSHQLAQQMDGCLELESTSAQGSVFRLSIPLP